MTKKHFTHAAAMVAAILAGDWTNDLPTWAHGAWNARTSIGEIEIDTVNLGNVPVERLRAIWTAEAFVMLFETHNPRFDRARFLKACGL